jgi:hypothetical protein
LTLYDFICVLEPSLPKDIHEIALEQ